MSFYPEPPAGDVFARVPELMATPIAFPWGTVAVWVPVPWWLDDDDMTEHGAPWPFSYGKPIYAADIIDDMMKGNALFKRLNAKKDKVDG